MTRIGRRLIEDFLLPALNDGRYGDLLMWTEKEKGHFSIWWSHKNAAKWSDRDTLVFQDWDRLKGRFKPEQKGYFMQAKQRFRAALYKLNTVEKLHCDEKYRKYYRLRLDADRRHETRKMHHRLIKKENRRSIPTPVICRNTVKGTELVGQGAENFMEESSSSSASSPSSIKSEECDRLQNEIEYCLGEYPNAIKRQRKQSSPNHYPPYAMKAKGSDCETSVLRDSPQMNIARKHPHVPVSLAPVYNKATSCQALENSHKQIENSQRQQVAVNFLNSQAVDNQHRVESPHLMVVPTYNTDDEYNAILEMDQDAVTAAACLASFKNSDGALNLSIKCETNGVLCR